MPRKRQEKPSRRTAFKKMQPILFHAVTHLDEDVSLDALANWSGLSGPHLQRVFAATIGESPKQITLRLRLERAAAMLLTSKRTVLDVALDCGFQSHEVLTRSFRRCFGMPPRAYRTHGSLTGMDNVRAKDHAAVVSKVGPCIGLYHIREDWRLQTPDMAQIITKKEITPQPVLLIQRRIKPADLASTLAQVLGHIFAFAQKHGIPLAGQPLTRYLEWGPGLWNIEAGLPISASPREPVTGAEVRADTLPGGSVATTTHAGPYETLSQTHAAVQQSRPVSDVLTSL